MIRRIVEAIRKSCVDVWIVVESPLPRIGGDVRELVAIVTWFGDPVGVVTRRPDFTGVIRPDLFVKAIPQSEGVTAFDQFDGTFDSVRGRQKHVDVLRHDDEAVEKKARLVTITEQRRDKKFSVGLRLEDAAALEGNRSQRVRLKSHWKRSISQGLKPLPRYVVPGLPGLKPRPIR